MAQVQQVYESELCRNSPRDIFGPLKVFCRLVFLQLYWMQCDAQPVYMKLPT